MKLKTRISLSNFRNKQSVEKNITNLNLYKSNLNKVDKALRINHPRGSITHNNANNANEDCRIIKPIQLNIKDNKKHISSQYQANHLKTSKLINYLSTSKNVNDCSGEKNSKNAQYSSQINLNSKILSEINHKPNDTCKSKYFSSGSGIENEQLEIVSHHIIDESASEDDFYTNEEFDFDNSKQEMVRNEAFTPSVQISKHKKNSFNPSELVLSKYT